MNNAKRIFVHKDNQFEQFLEEQIERSDARHIGVL